MFIWLFTPMQTKSALANLDWSLWLNSNSVGCTKCNDNFVALQFDSVKATCLKSDWVSKNVDTKPTVAYIPNCKNYNFKADANYIRNCNACNTNFVPSGTSTGSVVTLDYANCFSNSSLLNCAVASSSSVCIQCKDATFSLKTSGVSCELGNIPNCVAYNYLEPKSSITCKQCAPDYYLDTVKNACVMGKIYKCKILANDSATTCNTCNDGFVRIGNILNSFDYCYQMDSALGCSGMNVVNDSTFNGGKITFTSCTSPATK